MKKIDKIIKKLYLEIILAMSFVLITIPIYKEISNNTQYKIRNATYAYISNITSYTETANKQNLNLQKITIANSTKKVQEYALIAKIKKDMHNMEEYQIRINQYTKYIKEYFFTEDDEYNYYLIKKGYVEENEINLWIKITTGKEEQGKVDYLLELWDINKIKK